MPNSIDHPNWKDYPCEIVGTGRMIRAHYIKLFGKLPEGTNVLHRCDNPTCRNTYHWFLGSQSDNMKDKVRKGRQTGGWATPKITIDQLRFIRGSNEPTPKLAKTLGVSEGIVRRVRNGSRWKGTE